MNVKMGTFLKSLKELLNVLNVIGNAKHVVIMLINVKNALKIVIEMDLIANANFNI